MAGPGVTEGVDLAALVSRSVELLRMNQAPGGGYLASSTFEPYRFVWFRDGAFVADALSRAGEIESAEAFYGWCDRTIGARAARIDALIARHRERGEIGAAEHLSARYRANGAEADAPWSSFQLDGFGSWLWSLGEHRRRHGRRVTPFARGAALSVRYATEFWRDPCFDLWEERWGSHTVTLAALRAGLAAAAEWEELETGIREEAAATAAEIEHVLRADCIRVGRLAAEPGTDRLDSSLVACAVPFGAFEPHDPVVVATVAALEGSHAHGGVHRHADDSYYGGGEWLLLAALLGWWYAAVGRGDDAWAELEWVAAQATADGELPEQVSDHLLAPDALAEWVDRWGPPACPLLWSHAMLVILADELGVVAR